MDATRTRGTDLLLIAGTRPEALKLQPLVCALRRRAAIGIDLLWTGQQPHPPADGETVGWQSTPPPSHPLSRRNLEQSIERSVRDHLRRYPPDAVLVQGDTTSAYAGARAAQAEDVNLLHLEAGLRTSDARSPFPEEIYRRRITTWADLHLVPSVRAAAQLQAEGVPSSRIAWVGSTAVDGLLNQGVVKEQERYDLLVDVHRRENAGRALKSLGQAISLLSQQGWRIALVSHPNAAWQRLWSDALDAPSTLNVLPALSRSRWLSLARCAGAVLTDSGGAAEELPYLGVPLLIYRRACERPEAIESGHAVLVPPAGIPTLVPAIKNAVHAQTWPAAWPLSPTSPYGDGHAGERAAAAVVCWLHRRRKRTSNRCQSAQG